MKSLRNILTRLVAATLLLAGVGIENAAAQSLPYSAILATGGGTASSVRDADAIFLNPANIVYKDRGGRVVVSLFPVRLAGGGSLLQFGFYHDGLRAGELGDEQKRELIDGWFGSYDANATRYAGAAAGVVPLAVAVRGENWAVGLAAQLRSHSRVGMNRGLVELALFGLEEERSVPLDAEVQSMNAVYLSAAFSRRFSDVGLSVGVAPKFILGTSYARGHLNSTLEVTEEALIHAFDYAVWSAGSYSRDVLDRFELLGGIPAEGQAAVNPFGSVAGKGAGIDLGLTYEASRDLHLSTSLTDLGFISWNSDARRITPLRSELRFEGFELDSKRIDSEFDGDTGAYFMHVLDSLADDAYATVKREEATFTSGTPAALHTGGTWHFANRLGAASVGLTLPLNAAPGNVTRRPSLYLGAEYRIGRRFGIPLRAGLRAGGPGAVRLGFGTGIHTPVWELGVSASATPSSEALGGGLQLTAGVSLLNLRFGR